MECKAILQPTGEPHSNDLIETLWNVKNVTGWSRSQLYADLIETLWNVKE